MNKKVIPNWLQNPLLIRIVKSDVGVILSYWLFQGMLYMDFREVIFKIFLDIIFTLTFFLLGMPFMLALILAHTFNMFLNGHYYVMKHNMGRIKNEPKEFIAYIEKLYNRIQRTDFILGTAAYGSLSRDSFSTTSDVDIRIFPKKGFMNWLKVILWVFAERTRAFLYSFPLDIYAFDFEVIDSKMRADEPPIIFADLESQLAKKYSNHILFDRFAQTFREKNVKE